MRSTLRRSGAAIDRIHRPTDADAASRRGTGCPAGFACGSAGRASTAPARGLNAVPAAVRISSGCFASLLSRRWRTTRETGQSPRQEILPRQRRDALTVVAGLADLLGRTDEICLESDESGRFYLAFSAISRPPIRPQRDRYAERHDPELRRQPEGHHLAACTLVRAVSFFNHWAVDQLCSEVTGEGHTLTARGPYNVVTASEARELDVFRDRSNRLLDRAVHPAERIERLGVCDGYCA